MLVLQKYLKPSLPLRKALTILYGVGTKRAQVICDRLGLGPYKTVREIPYKSVVRLHRLLTTSFYVENDLRKMMREDLERLQSIHSYRWLRHAMKLPTRGQRTHTNAKSCKKTSQRLVFLRSAKKESSSNKKGKKN